MKKVITKHYCDRCHLEITALETAGINTLKLDATGTVVPDSHYPEKKETVATQWVDLCQTCQVAVYLFVRAPTSQPKLSEINEAREFFQTLLADRDERDRPTYAANSVLTRAFKMLSTGVGHDRS